MACEIPLVREMMGTALRALLVGSRAFVRRQVSMTFPKTVQSLVHAPGQASSTQVLPRR
jgi:hypothetical protein